MPFLRVNHKELCLSESLCSLPGLPSKEHVLSRILFLKNMNQTDCFVYASIRIELYRSWQKCHIRLRSTSNVLQALIRLHQKYLDFKRQKFHPFLDRKQQEHNFRLDLIELFDIRHPSARNANLIATYFEPFKRQLEFPFNQRFTAYNCKQTDYFDTENHQQTTPPTGSISNDTFMTIDFQPSSQSTPLIDIKAKSNTRSSTSAKHLWFQCSTDQSSDSELELINQLLDGISDQTMIDEPICI